MVLEPALPKIFLQPKKPVEESKPPEIHKTENTCTSLKPLIKEDKEMAPRRIKVAPFVVKSEPCTPVYETHSKPEEAPDDWFAPVEHKEKLAIMTIEHIPLILAESTKDHTAPMPTDHFSPRLLPLLDRMKIHFSRSMALARCEAENGSFDWQGTPGTTTRPQHPVLPVDVMSSLHVEAFLAGIEEVRHPEKGDRVVYRRYWRIVEAPAGLEQRLGGVVSAGSLLKHHVEHRVKKSVQEQWNEIPKVLLAEFEVGADGLSLNGKMLRTKEELEWE